MRYKYQDYFVTIGLEVHVALSTKQKLFSETPNSFEVKKVSLLDIATPGVLPTLKKEAVELACVFGLATQSQIHLYSEFERKHYFYPDLALGYQITQQHKPLIGEGFIPIEIDGIKKLVEIEHAHLECDAAKSLHDMYREYTAIDVSRGGTALLEIVSKPCMHSPKEAKEYAKVIHSMVKTLGICDGKMEEGSFRVDASISLCKDENILGTRVEIKNISSFSFLEAALEYEMERQYDLLTKGEKVIMQTRLFNEETKTTLAMRDKETVQDYRYLQDPDIPALQLTEKFIEKVKDKHFYEFFPLVKFYKEKIEKEKIDVVSDKLIDLLSSSVGGYLFAIYKEPNLVRDISQAKLLKALFYWLPEVIQKYEAEDVVLPGLEEMLKVLKSPVEAKEFKDLIYQWLDDTSVSIVSLIREESPEDTILIQSTVDSILVEFKTQIEDPKVMVEKKIQFVMGQCMKKLKGKVIASKLSDYIKEKLST
jgi:aspartyl-tRNA(Asn)/glutamyl-tRNA(Gln) amidotransferase subunit B